MSSKKYFEDAGKTSPDSRFSTIRTNPIASIPRRGLISAQTCGSIFHVGSLGVRLCAVPEEWPTRSALRASWPELFEEKGLIISVRAHASLDYSGSLLCARRRVLEENGRELRFPSVYKVVVISLEVPLAAGM